MRDRQLDQEGGAPARLNERDLASVLLDDAVGDREPQPGAGSDVLGREEGVEDARRDLRRNSGAAVGEDDLDRLAFERRADPDLAMRSVLQRVAGIREQVDEDLLELNRVAEHN